MLKLEPIEIILRTIPEGILYIIALNIFSNKKMEKKNYIVSALVIGLGIYIFRALPISYGVHTVLTILLIAFLGIIYNKLEPVQAIIYTIFMFIIQFLSEIINVLIINSIPNIDIDNLFNVPLYKNLLGIPSLVICLITLLLLKKYIEIRNKNKNE